MRRGLAAALASLLVGLGLLVAGFFAFANRIPTAAAPLPARADGIVALTGGQDRIQDAVDLLADGRGARLLITGVHPTTSGRELARLVPRFGQVINCCIDLDRRALNTAGNAIETRRWAAERGYRRLIVVTSGWHMPRALVELSRALPDVELVPYPVVPAGVDTSAWWKNGTTFRLLAVEYVKYVAALARVRFAPRIAPEAGESVAANRL